MSENRRQNLYFPAEMLDELKREAVRQERSISWLLQQAWKLSRKDMKHIPGTSDFLRTSLPSKNAPIK